jgi:hypothetical protein
VAGHGRKPVGEDVAPSASWARDTDRFPQFPQREAVQVGQATVSCWACATAIGSRESTASLNIMLNRHGL